MGVIFVGSNPSAAAKNHTPFDFSTKSGQLLHNWINMARIDNYIMLNVHNKPTPNNRPLNKSEIRAALINLMANLSMYPNAHVVALGKTAETALTMLNIKHFAMPHPSGLNRLLNDPKYVEEK